MLPAIKCGCVHVYTVYTHTHIMCVCVYISFLWVWIFTYVLSYPHKNTPVLSPCQKNNSCPVPFPRSAFFFRGGSCFFNNNFTHLTNSVQSFNTATLDSSDLPGSSISVIRGSLSITPTTLLVFEVWRLRHASSFQSTHVMHRSGGSNQRRWEKVKKRQQKE